MKKIDQIPGLPLIVLVLMLLSGCGGSGGSSNPNVTITPDGLLDQVPGAADLGVITDLVNAVAENAGTGTTGFPTPLVRTLNWPADFPADIRAGLTDTILISGLPTRSAYDFDVTLPASVDSDDTTLFVMNLSEDQQVGGQVCSGDPDCTGTVNYATVSLQAPDGQVIKLADHVPGVDFSGTVYSDFAALPNPSSESFYYHSFKRYRPDGALHSLHGINKSGDWTLHVTDSVYTNRSDALGGTLTGWGLRLGTLPE